MDTFSPARAPSADNSQIDITPRVIRAPFGDGYVQDIPDGINVAPRSFQCSWTPLALSDGQAIIAFFDGHVGQSFLYTLFGETIARKWKVKGTYSMKYLSAETVAVSATLDERFDLSA